MSIKINKLYHPPVGINMVHVGSTQIFPQWLFKVGSGIWYKFALRIEKGAQNN